jgi:hypothetical protein
MSKYGDDKTCRLRSGYNTRRGEVLDGVRVSLTKCGPRWWSVGGPHGVEDGSLHHQIMCFLEKQPGRQATCAAIRVKMNITQKQLTGYLRELEKQEIAEMTH